MRIKTSAVCWFFTALMVMLSAPAQGAYDYVDISNPSLRKIPIAIPLFKTMPQPQPRIAQEGVQELMDNLTFTGYFKVIEPRLYLEDLQSGGITEADIRFKKWTQIGSELLVTGGIQVNGDILEVEMRLFDTVRGELIVGKRYKGWEKDLPRMVRRFADEIIHSLTGQWGVFDTRIALVSNGTGTKEIFICDYDGSNPVQVTNHNSISMSPAWSSDGNLIAYMSYTTGRPSIHIRDIEGGAGTVIHKQGLNATPAWYPGKAMLAATLSFEGDQEIYLLTREGKMTQKLTSQPGIDTSPTWSPDGSRMAFVSNRAGNPQIYIEDVDGGSVRRLTFQGNYNTQPDWSPKGDQIAYSSMEGNQINIYVIKVNGGGPVRLTSGAGRNESPSWSPDGSMIVFSSTREGAPGIFVMTAYGTDQRRLLSLPGAQTDPAWSPRMTQR